MENFNPTDDRQLMKGTLNPNVNKKQIKVKRI